MVDQDERGSTNRVTSQQDPVAVTSNPDEQNQTTHTETGQPLSILEQVSQRVENDAIPAGITSQTQVQHLHMLTENSESSSKQQDQTANENPAHSPEYKSQVRRQQEATPVKKDKAQMTFDKKKLQNKTNSKETVTIELSHLESDYEEQKSAMQLSQPQRQSHQKLQTDPSMESIKIKMPLMSSIESLDGEISHQRLEFEQKSQSAATILPKGRDQYIYTAKFKNSVASSDLYSDESTENVVPVKSSQFYKGSQHSQSRDIDAPSKQDSRLSKGRFSHQPTTAKIEPSFVNHSSQEPRSKDRSSQGNGDRSSFNSKRKRKQWPTNVDKDSASTKDQRSKTHDTPQSRHEHNKSTHSRQSQETDHFSQHRQSRSRSEKQKPTKQEQTNHHYSKTLTLTPKAKGFDSTVSRASRQSKDSQKRETRPDLQAVRKSKNRDNKSLRSESQNVEPHSSTSKKQTKLGGALKHSNKPGGSFMAQKVKSMMNLSSNKREQLEQHTGIDFLINEKKEESRLSKFWSKVVLAIHTYNFVTVFFFLGIEGFPESLWLLLEIVTELLIAVDFVLRLVIRLKCPTIWNEMWLLHDKGSRSKFHLLIRLIGSVPQSLILCLIYGSKDNLQALVAIEFAILRCLKLLRLRQISQYFEKVDFQSKRSKKQSFLQGLMVVYYFLLATHFIGCMWLLVARLESSADKGWFAMARFNQYEVSTFDKYIESLFFVVATMTGLGYGNIVPSTNPEWLTDCFIMITGASIYANFFANFAVEIYNQNKKQIDNNKRFDQAKQFAQQRQVSDDLKKKIRHYYNNLRLNFSDFTQKNDILDELPVSIQQELSLVFNRQLIQEVKFFQLAEPNFIMAISRLLKPQISIVGEYVVRIDEVATKMYFINSGLVEVLATDNITPLAYQGSGCYFGEIGIFITGKRSCSVKVKLSAILSTIAKPELLKMLETFPRQAKFLRAVGRQRLQTTKVEDLRGTDPSEMEKFIQSELNEEVNNNTSNILNKSSTTVPNQFRISQVDQKLTASANVLHSQNQMNFSRQHSTKFQDLNRKPKYWQTSYFNKFDYFLIVPFSPLFYVWNSLLLLTVVYDTWMVPFSIALNFDFYGVFYGIDVLAILVYMVDIYMRSKTAITTPQSICLDPASVMHHYVNSWLILDLLACLPFEYFMLPFAANYMHYIRYVRLFRLCKFGRVYELIQLVQTHSDFPTSAFTFVKLSLFFMLAAHFMACTYIFIGMRQDESDRFDGQTMFGDMLNRNFITLKPAKEMAEIELYWQFLYLSSCTMGAVMYGDIIPYTLAEQLFTFLAMFSARIYLAFVFAEAANYLSQMHVNKSIHNQKTKRIETWMKQNNFPSKLIDRVNNFHLMLWNDFQGINEQEILHDLPESLRNDIRYHLLHNLILNWEAFPKSNSRGAMQTVIANLKLQIIPKGEYIIRIGQVAEEMYFIVKGICRVLNDEGVELAILKQGQNFGEMALLDASSPLRNASVVSITKCSLAVLTKADFELICEMYPQFKNKIFELAKQRKISNLQKEKDAKILKEQTTSQLGVVLEEEDKSFVSDSSSYAKNSSDQNPHEDEQQISQVNGLDDPSLQQSNSAREPGHDGFQINGDGRSRSRTRTPIRAFASQEERRNSAGHNLATNDNNRVTFLNDIQQSGGNQGLNNPGTGRDSKSQSASGGNSEEERSSSAHRTRTQSQQETMSRGGQYDEVAEANFINHFSPVMPLSPMTIPSPKKDKKLNKGTAEQEVIQLSDDDERKLTDRGTITDWDREEDDQGLIKPSSTSDKKQVHFADQQPVVYEQSLRKKQQTSTSSRSLKSDSDQASSDLPPKGQTNKNVTSPTKVDKTKVYPELMQQTAQARNDQRRRGTIVYANIDQYIKIQESEEDNQDSLLHKCLSIKNAIQFCITLASVYNIIFIPLSFAFRVPIEGVYLTLEVLTVFFYMVDICLRWSKLNNYYQLEKIPDSRLNTADRKLKNDPEQLHRMMRIQKVEIGCSVAGCLPIVSILGFLEIYRPWLLICLLSSIRLVKIRPVFQVFNALKDRNLNLWRIIEVLTYYYLICHYLACILLANAAFNHDARNVWLRRIPVPQEDDIRTEKSVFTDMSSLSIYTHAIYFVVNTISHVAIGDITSVTTNERIFNAFLILMGTFIYSFLFGNITAIVSSLAPSQNMEFYSQYNFVMNKLKNGRTPLKTIHDVNQYFDYQWSLYKGLNVEKSIEQLPDSIKSDVLISRYQDTVETSLLFRENTGQIDVALAASIFKKFKIQVYHN